MNLVPQAQKFEGSIRSVAGQNQFVVPQQQKIINPRYEKWFQGTRSVQELRERRPERALSKSEIGEITLGKLTFAGTGLHDKLTKILPEGHRMEEAVRAKLLKDIPHMGSCRIGRVIVGQEGSRFKVAEFYVTNFDAHISTETRQFYNVNLNGKESVFFGVGVLTDSDFNSVDFDRQLGDQGVYFQTKSIVQATYAMAGISTGKRLSELMELDKNNFKNYKNPSG